jgi:hypothetical protein
MCLIVVNEKHFVGNARDLHVSVLTFSVIWSVSMDFFGLGTLRPKTEPRTKLSVFRFFGSASVLDPGNFNVRLRCWFLTQVEPNNRGTDWPVRLSFQSLIFSQPAVFFSHNKLANITFSQANRTIPQSWMQPTKAHNAPLWAGLRPLPVSFSCPTPSGSLTSSPIRVPLSPTRHSDSPSETLKPSDGGATGRRSGGA